MMLCLLSSYNRGVEKDSTLLAGEGVENYEIKTLHQHLMKNQQFYPLENKKIN